MPAPAGLDAGTASQLIPGVRPTVLERARANSTMKLTMGSSGAAVVACIACANATVPNVRTSPQSQLAPCNSGDVYFTQLCTQPLKPQAPDGVSPRLLGVDRRPDACSDGAVGSAGQARVEVLVDLQGRVSRARLLEPPAACGRACLEGAYTLMFAPARVSGRASIERTTLVCGRRPEAERRSGRTRG